MILIMHNFNKHRLIVIQYLAFTASYRYAYLSTNYLKLCFRLWSDHLLVDCKISPSSTCCLLHQLSIVKCKPPPLAKSYFNILSAFHKVCLRHFDSCPMQYIWIMIPIIEMNFQYICYNIYSTGIIS